MITRFTNSLKESGKLNLAVTILFFTGILISTYFLITLPHNLTMKGGLPSVILAWPVLVRVFVAVGFTFVAGIATVNVALQSRKEIIVYLEKKSEEESRAAESIEEAANELRDISAFKATLEKASGEEILQTGLNTLCQEVSAGQGALYLSREFENKKILELSFGFALSIGEHNSVRYEIGEGLIGQAAASGATLYLDEVPEGYITIISGLGTASPRYLVVVPVRRANEIKGIIEIATFSQLNESQRKQIEDRATVLAEYINQ